MFAKHILSSSRLAQRSLDAFRGVQETAAEEIHIPVWGAIMMATTLIVLIITECIVCIISVYP